MAREVTKPRTVKVSHQCLNQFIVSLTRDPETKAVNLETSVLIYTVVDLLENGVEVDRQEKRVQAYLWPQELLTEIKAIHDRLCEDAEKSGYLEAGQEHEDLPAKLPQAKTLEPAGNGSA